eukprot:9881827-Karenia_brevis.AAC.1
MTEVLCGGMIGKGSPYSSKALFDNIVNDNENDKSDARLGGLCRNLGMLAQTAPAFAEPGPRALSLLSLRREFLGELRPSVPISSYVNP